MLKRRLESFTKYHPSVSVFADPMLLFTFMTLQATIIFLCKIMEQLEQIDQFRSTQVEYRKRALTAAKEIARLSKEQGHSGYFKVGSEDTRHFFYANLQCFVPLPCSHLFRPTSSFPSPSSLVPNASSSIDRHAYQNYKVLRRKPLKLSCKIVLKHYARCRLSTISLSTICSCSNPATSRR